MFKKLISIVTHHKGLIRIVKILGCLTCFAFLLGMVVSDSILYPSIPYNSWEEFQSAILATDFSTITIPESSTNIGVGLLVLIILPFLFVGIHTIVEDVLPRAKVFLTGKR